MIKKVANLNERRRKKKPRRLNEAAKAAVRRFCDPEFLKSVEEPKGLASGKTTRSGSFVHNDDEKDEDEKDEK